MIPSQLMRNLLCRSFTNLAPLPVAAVAPLLINKFNGVLSNKASCSASFLAWGNTSLHTSAAHEAARKGTRARREAIKKANKKKKVAEEVQKTGFIPFELRNRMKKFGKVTPRKDLDHLPPSPTDNVYGSRFFQWRTYSIADAVEMHRESHHPTMYNAPESTVFLFLELSLSLDKKNRYLEQIGGVLTLPCPYPMGEQRLVAVLSEQPEVRAQAQEMGAHLVGGREVVKLVLDGSVDMSQFDHVVSSMEILTDLAPIRGILKKAFPNSRNGTATTDVPAAVDRFLNGLKYQIVQDKNDLDYGSASLPVGKLTSISEDIAANVETLLKDVHEQRTKGKSTDLITKAYIKCPPTSEIFAIDFRKILGLEEKTEENKQPLKSAASN